VSRGPGRPFSINTTMEYGDKNPATNGPFAYSDNVNSPALKVFGMLELLEGIVLDLPLADAMNARKVCIFESITSLHLV
jgi:hypothetical protein